MDGHEQNEQHKDLLTSFFPSESTNHLQQGFDGHQLATPMFQFNPAMVHQQGMGPPQHISGPQANADMLGNWMQIQGIDNQSYGTMSPRGPFNPQSMLEQQFKLTQLQQLQHLQNQIFQQQIALISSQTPGIMQSSPPMDARRDQPASLSSLPTPGPSAEIHPQQQPIEFISPMVLNKQNFMDTQEGYPNQGVDIVPPMISHNAHTYYGPPRGSASAPERIAFRTSPSFRTHMSPIDPDIDISPLTSPWLAPHPQSNQQAQGSNKRNASSSGDEGSMQPSRKKQSPAIRPTNPMQAKKIIRNTKSTSSTPLLRSTRSRKESISGEVVGDSPSPVDLSMPPPAPPTNQAAASSSNPAGNYSHNPSSPDLNPQLTPVTPASIMKLGRLGINSSLGPTRQMMPPDDKAKGVSKFKNITEPTSRNKLPKRNVNGTLTSPGLKPILPAGTTPPLNIGPSLAAPPGPVVQVRKTSHKAAEQKRRDSLKTTFDDLRGLLPPIPLPSDDKFPDEPILPGALPPRGPPKAGGEGPNKAVSKLQLLMCGNEYIRVLKARVQRRDEEIDKLRREVRRLRDIGGMNGMIEGMEELDLDRDLDAVETFSFRLGGGGDEDEDDPGEE